MDGTEVPETAEKKVMGVTFGSEMGVTELNPPLLFLLFLWRHARPYQSGAGLINLTRQSFLCLTHSEPTCFRNSVLVRYDRDLPVMI